MPSNNSSKISHSPLCPFLGKAEAARLVKASSKPTSLAFLVETAVPPRRCQIFWGDKRVMGPQETTREKKLVYWHLSTPSKMFPQWTFWQ
jgi:hypothetical protein